MLNLNFSHFNEHTDSKTGKWVKKWMHERMAKEGFTSVWNNPNITHALLIPNWVTSWTQTSSFSRL